MKRNLNIFFIIVAIIGFISFFMPWIGDTHRYMSGYDFVSSGKKIDKNVIFILGLPISFLLVILLKIIKNIPAFLVKLVELIPIGIIIIVFVKFFGKNGFEELKYVDEELLKIFGIGFILTLLSSIIIIFDPLLKNKNNQ